MKMEANTTFSGDLEIELLPKYNGQNATEVRSYPNFYNIPEGPNPLPELTIRAKMSLRWHSWLLQWKLNNGLAKRGQHPAFVPEPKTFLAKVYLKVFK
jgi:hypothetical protein